MAWTCEPAWSGQAAFIIAGGPSVSTQNLDLLFGRKVIVINSSVYEYPSADVLFFGDARWYRDVPENKKVADEFEGLVITTQAVKSDKIKIMNKVNPPGLSKDRKGLTIKRTSLTAAINLAVHLGANPIVLLGADGKKSPDGRTHHHKPHKWPARPGCWDLHRKDLETLVKPLEESGVRIFNASPGSAWDMWPIVTLEQVFHDQINCL